MPTLIDLIEAESVLVREMTHDGEVMAAGNARMATQTACAEIESCLMNDDVSCTLLPFREVRVEIERRYNTVDGDVWSVFRCNAIHNCREGHITNLRFLVDVLSISSMKGG
jgi:hypothetical protein